jgi:hypothetical protein
MTNTFLIRFSAIAAVSLVAIASTAAAGGLPRPLGPGEEKLSPGVHVLDLVSLEHGPTGYAHLPRIAVTLPSGWFNYNGWAMNDGGALSMSFWDVDKVYPTPCQWQGKPMIDPGRTVDGLARALASRPLRHASTPMDVVLAGFRGKYLRWSVPSKINIPGCGQGYFESWTGRGWATDRWQQGAGQVDRLWILEVKGQRLVVDAAYLPWATRKQRTELDRIVHSIKFLSVVSRKTASAASGRKAGARNGSWIAYSTAPAGDASGGSGSDVFVARVGGTPVLVASRDMKIWNVCPVFSPNGRMLAFVRSAGRRVSSKVGFARETIVVVPIGGRGGNPPIAGGWRVLKVPGGPVRCPSWSSDSSRLAYVDRGRVVVRGLDGSRLQRADGDPTIHDFERSRREFVSPTGDLVASMSAPGIVVSRPDGSDRRVIKEYLYAIAGWSPDGRKLLVMSDEGGGFTMRAVSVAAPYPSTRVVDFVRVNNARSWPGYGDVSWQPIPQR